MAAATDVDLVDDLDLDIDDFDVDIQALDMDLLADDDQEFRGGGGAYYSAIFSDADIVSHSRHACEDGDGDNGAAATCGWLLTGLMGDDHYCGDGAEEEEEEAGSSPADSGVTDDGPLAPAAGNDDSAEAMSAYVAELERFLLVDDDVAPCGEEAEDLLGVVDHYFAGDQLRLATADAVPAAGGVAGRTDGEEEENDGDGVIAAREDEQSAEEARKEQDQGNSHADAMGRAGGDESGDDASHSDPSARSTLATSYGSSPVLHVECGPVGSLHDLVEFDLSSQS